MSNATRLRNGACATCANHRLQRCRPHKSGAVAYPRRRLERGTLVALLRCTARRIRLGVAKMNTVSKTSLVVSALCMTAGALPLAGCMDAEQPYDEGEGASAENIGQVSQAVVDTNGLCDDKWYYNHEANFNG